jgi:DNA replication protein DnaC
MAAQPAAVEMKALNRRLHRLEGNKSMVDALLSRVRHYCHTVTINGPSLREPQG